MPAPKPFQHQIDCFERFKDCSYFAIFADMGTGKSRMAIDVVKHKYSKGLSDRLVIIAPVVIGPQWHLEQLPMHLDVPYQSFVYRAGTTKKLKLAQDKFFADCRNNPDLQVYIINYEAFVKGKGNQLVLKFAQTSPKGWPPMILVDEASRMKNPDAKSVKNIKKLRDWWPAGFRTVLTGTPMAKSPVDAWSIFDFLKPNFMGCSHLAFKHFHEVQFDRKIKIKDKLQTVRTPLDAQSHMKIRKWLENNPKTADNTLHIMRKFGLSQEDFDMIINNENFVRFKNIEHLKKKIAPYTFSISKKDCLELPEKIYQMINLELNSEQKKHIKDLAMHSATSLRDKVLTISTKALLGIRVLQICGGNLPVHGYKDGEYDTIPIKGTNAKLNFILDDLEEAGDQQCIVWAVFKAEVDMLHFELGKKYMVGSMHGDTPTSLRGEIVEKFKRGEYQVLVSHPEVGGYGLNLPHAGLQYWYSRSYRTEARLQAEDRSHRIGTVRSPIYKDLVYNSAFERNVLKVLLEGADMNSQFVTISLNDLFTLT